MKNWPWRKILLTTVWVLIGIGFCVLMGAAMQYNSNKACKAINIKIESNENENFVTITDINNIIREAGYDTLYQKKYGNLRLKAIEQKIKQNPWISDAEVFVDDHTNVNIKVKQRCPLIRIINKFGVSYYFDKKGIKMPLHPNFTPRVIIVTGSVLAEDINTTQPEKSNIYPLILFCKYLNDDEFWNAQITQINVLPNKNLELSTLVGSATIEFGAAQDYEKKLLILKTFYTNILNKRGWSAFNKIILKYNNQIVCK